MPMPCFSTPLHAQHPAGGMGRGAAQDNPAGFPFGRLTRQRRAHEGIDDEVNSPASSIPWVVLPVAVLNASSPLSFVGGWDSIMIYSSREAPTTELPPPRAPAVVAMEGVPSISTQLESERIHLAHTSNP